MDGFFKMDLWISLMDFKIKLLPHQLQNKTKNNE